jgi:hypothetical protein
VYCKPLITVDLSLHESDCHLPTRPPHPGKSPPLCYFSLTARDLLIHYAWRYHCFVEYTLEGLTATVSRPSLHVVIRFSDPKSAFSIQNSIQLFDIRPRCRTAIRSCSRRSSHNETSTLQTKCRLASPSLPVRRFDLCKYRRSMRVRRRRARDRLTCAASLFTVLRVYS